MNESELAFGQIAAQGEALMLVLRNTIPADTPALVVAFACASMTGDALFQIRQHCEPDDREVMHIVTERIAACVRTVMYKGALE